MSAFGALRRGSITSCERLKQRIALHKRTRCEQQLNTKKRCCYAPNEFAQVSILVSADRLNKSRCSECCKRVVLIVSKNSRERKRNRSQLQLYDESETEVSQMHFNYFSLSLETKKNKKKDPKLFVSIQQTQLTLIFSNPKVRGMKSVRNDRHLIGS